MPYIKPDNRDRFEPVLAGIGETLPADAGELNYLLSSICDLYLKAKGKKYTNLNEVVGVLECAKLELYRRIAAPYEDKKCAINGDVYRHRSFM
jgi:hypothetical protein